MSNGPSDIPPHQRPTFGTHVHIPNVPNIFHKKNYPGHSETYPAPTEQAAPPNTTHWARQANPEPVVFNIGDTRLSSVFPNHGRFAEMNQQLTNFSGGGANYMVSDNLRPTEKMMRDIAINAVHDMTATGIQPLPAVIGVLLAKSEMSLGPNPRDVRKGWQVYIHSSSKGRTRGRQAQLHPDLQARISAAKLDHHFRSMCAEMALLSNYWYDNAAILHGQPGQFRPYGEEVCMISYNAADFAPDRDGRVRDGRGRYIDPCHHDPRPGGKCSNHRNHSGNCGCSDVLRLLGVKVVDRGGESGEQVPAVWREQEDAGAEGEVFGSGSQAPPLPAAGGGGPSAYGRGQGSSGQTHGGTGGPLRGWRTWGRGGRRS